MLVAISEPKNYRFVSPYTMRHDTREAVSVHDVQFLFSRKAAPRLNGRSSSPLSHGQRP